MASKWEKITLAEVCARGGGNIQTGPFGSQLHAEDYVEDGIPSVMPQNIGDNRIIEDGIARITPEDANRLGRYLLREGDVVYSRRGDIERRALVRTHEDGWLCGTGCLRVRFGKGVVVPEYAAFYLATHEARTWLKNHAVGATMPNLNTSILGALPFVLPPLPIQRQIAAILSAFDDKIELNRQMNRTLEAMARALFKSWFVDFDPVRAKMRGEQPEGMDAATAALFPSELVEVDGRKVPRGWEWQPFDTNLTIFGGGTPKTTNPDFWGGKIPWYSVVDVPSDSDIWVNKTEKTITEAGLNGSSTRLLPVGTTIISARGTVGKLALTAVPMAMNQSCYGLFPQDESSVNFVYFSTLAAVDELKRRTHGAVFDTITRNTLQSINSAFPTPELLAAFESATGQLTKMILNNVRESARPQ